LLKLDLPCREAAGFYLAISNDERRVGWRGRKTQFIRVVENKSQVVAIAGANAFLEMLLREACPLRDL
jgi:hypothetical protein